MATNLWTSSSAGCVVVDSNVFIAICANEPSAATAKAAIANYSNRNWAFFAPGVMFSEVLFALCRKLQEGDLDAAKHQEAVEDFKDYITSFLAPPSGDAALVARAEEIRARYSCLHSADSFYLALAEELTLSGPAEYLTFDKRVVNVAAKNAPTVKVKLLPS